MSADHASSPFESRLAEAARLYDEWSQGRDEPGWGAAPDAASSIEDTSRVLAILRLAGWPAQSEAVRRGESFLARASEQELALTESADARAAASAFVLLGLTQFNGRVFPTTSTGEAIERSLAVLRSADVVHRNGGSRSASPALTWLASLQLSALASAGSLDVCAEPLRVALVDAQCPDGSWPGDATPGVRPVCGGSPETALGALALTAWQADRPRVTRAGEWLLAHPSSWTHKHHVRKFEHYRSAVHMTFALGFRACLAAGVRPDHPTLLAVERYMNRLWDPEERQWSVGVDPRQFSPKSTYEVALAYDAWAKSAAAAQA